jgi:hypothetical protein
MSFMLVGPKTDSVNRFVEPVAVRSDTTVGPLIFIAVVLIVFAVRADAVMVSTPNVEEEISLANRKARVEVPVTSKLVRDDSPSTRTSERVVSPVIVRDVPEISFVIKDLDERGPEIVRAEKLASFLTFRESRVVAPANTVFNVDLPYTRRAPLSLVSLSAVNIL